MESINSTEQNLSAFGNLELVLCAVQAVMTGLGVSEKGCPNIAVLIGKMMIDHVILAVPHV